jgi:hypothetical protein
VPQALIEHQPSIAVTKQTGTFGGQSVAYTAIVEENILKGRQRSQRVSRDDCLRA